VTVGLGEYAAGAAELVVVVAAAAYAASGARARLLPGWTGAPARLAEAVLGLALVVWVAQVLGTFSLLTELGVVLATTVAGAAIGFWTRRAGADARPNEAPAVGAEGAASGGRVSAPALAVTVGVVALLFAHWGFETQQSLNNAITNFDSRWYHLPFAAEFAQSGSTTELVQTDPLFLNWFYPQVSELLGGVAILLTERDTLALFMNLGWLALALLAAWCIGRPYGRGPHAVAAVAVLLESHNLVVREPGTLKNDVAAAALLLAACAILVTVNRTTGTVPSVPRRGALAVAGIAAGLACGVKLTVLAPVAALTVAVVVLARGGERLRAAAWWGVPMLLAGGYWYARNLFHAANPLPWITDLGPISLPGPERLEEAREPFSVAHYATDFEVWADWFGPGLEGAFGVLWPIVIGAAIGGMVLAALRRTDPPDRLLRALGLVGLFGVLAYLFTPLGAAGEEGMPVAFEINVRFAIPALLLGLSLFAVAMPARSIAAGWALLLAPLVVLAITDEPFDVLTADERAAGVAIAFAFVLIPAALRALHRRGALPRPAFLAALAALGLGVVAAGYGVQNAYLEDRFAAFESDARVDEAWRFANELDGARIGLAGTTAGFYRYGFYGGELSNEVVYLGLPGAKGAFSAIPSCEEWRAAVNAAGIDYLVTSPGLNFDEPASPLPSPEEGWLGADPVLQRAGGEDDVTVWRVDRELDPAGC
jgi:hypothetical protein